MHCSASTPPQMMFNSRIWLVSEGGGLRKRESHGGEALLSNLCCRRSCCRRMPVKGEYFLLRDKRVRYRRTCEDVDTNLSPTSTTTINHLHVGCSRSELWLDRICSVASMVCRYLGNNLPYSPILLQ